MDKAAQLELKYEHSQPFELVLVTRDADGKPTGSKSCIADNPFKIWQFYLRHKGKPKPKTKEGDKAKDVKLVKQHGSIQSYVDTSEREVKDNGKERTS